jgi:hypothetical protein
MNPFPKEMQEQIVRASIEVAAAETAAEVWAGMVADQRISIEQAMRYLNGASEKAGPALEFLEQVQKAVARAEREFKAERAKAQQAQDRAGIDEFLASCKTDAN